MYRSPHVPSYGPRSARIAIVAEAPGKVEVQLGRPLVGPSGRLLNDWLDLVGIRRKDVWTGNIYNYMAPASKIEFAPKGEVEAWASCIHQRLEQELDDPWVIVPMGAISLRAILRKPLWDKRSPTIGSWRGSITSTYLHGRKVKVIPVLHPAGVLRDMSLWKLCLADWKRISEDSKFRGLRHPKRLLHLPPHGPEIKRLFTEAKNPNTLMAIDIETPRRKGVGRRIECVCVSTDANEAWAFRWPEDRGDIEVLCRSRCQKVGQNFLFDRFWLAGEGIEVVGEIHDTLSQLHSIDASLPSFSLATIGSLVTRQPYWKKHSGADKESDTDSIDWTPRKNLMLYCCTDAATTREAAGVFLNVLEGERPPWVPKQLTN